MPICLVRWPDLSAWLGRAGNEGEVPDILDQVANPEACEWTLAEGLVLNKAEAAWLEACWLATGALR